MILLKVAKCFLLRYLSFVKHTWRRIQPKKSRQKGLRYLSLRRSFKGKYTFLISYIENLFLQLKSCKLST